MTRKSFIQNLSISSLIIPTIIKNVDLNLNLDKNEFLKRIITANNKEVIRLQLTHKQEITELKRSLGFDLANLAAAYIEPNSVYYHSEEIAELMRKIIDFLSSQQKPDGTLDFGNLSSPPDTAFIIDPLCSAAMICQNESTLAYVFQSLKTFIEKACKQLAVGGVHTPNHRWVVSAALAKANHLFPNKSYINRINEWLSEEVFQDKDGVYIERSITYAEVVNRSLIFIAKYASKPELFELVKKNLNWLFYCMEPNGDMVTVQSRRQDAFQHRNITEFYVHFRYMANKFNNPLFGAMTKFIETMPNFSSEVEKNLLYFVKEDKLYAENPPQTELTATFEILFNEISLLRKRKGDTSLYLFAGNDWPIIVASGRNTNPNFFAFRKGEAILKHIRLSTTFFSTGYFRGKGIEKIGNSYKIYQKFEAPYYQPMPDAYKKKDGDYALSQSTDGRFWNKMDFAHRPKSNVQTLETEIIYEEKEGKQLLHFDVKGPAGVKAVVELCFEANGQLENCVSFGENDNFLPTGYGKFSVGGDSITFGPGKKEHAWTTELEGELYSTHFGTLRTNGKYVFLTVICPFKHTLEIF